MVKKKRQEYSINPVESQLRGMSDDENYSVRPIKVDEDEEGDLADRLAARHAREAQSEEEIPIPASQAPGSPIAEVPVPDLAPGQASLINKILLPVDGSVNANLAAEWGFRFALAFRAEVILLTVTNQEVPLVPSLPLMPGPIVSPPPAQEIDTGLSQLAELGQQLGVSVRTVVKEGPPAQQILDVARDEQADLIIMAAHSRGRIASFLLGSVSQLVLHEARCPVLIYGEKAH